MPVNLGKKSSVSGFAKFCADYAVVLNKKSKLEAANSVQQNTITEQNEKLMKLSDVKCVMRITRKPSVNGDAKSYADYVVVLNEKSKLEATNSVLQNTITEQNEKLMKLTDRLSECKERNLFNERRIYRLEKDIEKVRNKECLQNQKHEKEMTKRNDREKLLKLEIESLRGELEKCFSKIARLNTDLDQAKVRSNEYKEKLKSSMNVLTSLTNSVEPKTNKFSQTITNACQFTDLDEARIISEVFLNKSCIRKL